MCVFPNNYTVGKLDEDEDGIVGVGEVKNGDSPRQNQIKSNQMDCGLVKVREQRAERKREEHFSRLKENRGSVVVKASECVQTDSDTV